MDRRIGMGTRWARLLLVAPLLAAGLAAGGATPVGAAYACTTFITGGTIRDSVVVPAGQLCVLTDVVVRGGVTVEAGASLQVQGAEIRGSVAALGHRDVVITSEVRGNVTMVGGTALSSVIAGEVRGDVSISGNSGDRVELIGVWIRGSATVDDNHVASSVQITRNVIDVDLACAGNSPAPSNTDYGPNTVHGARSGQCSGL